MKYSDKTYQQAIRIIYDRRLKAENDALARKNAFVQSNPVLLDIENKMMQTGLDTVKAISGCDDPKKYIQNLAKKNLAFQKARADLLQAAGYDTDYLKPTYTCPVCKDTGYVNGKQCSCLTELLKKYAYSELAEISSLKISSFDDFDISLYPTKDRQHMKEIFDFCVEYADDFDTTSPSIFMFGATGLGKTHLSLAIAGKAIEKGFTVVYGSAQNLLTMVERERFGRSDEPDGTTEDKLLSCDLLIFDDLGAEFTRPFSVAEIYNIINTRLSRELPTIINSNDSFDELEKRYTSRVTSRIIGTYQTLKFSGNDIRQIKNN